MDTALRQKLVVQPGGVIEIRSPELSPGALAEVIVILEKPPVTAQGLGWPPGFFEQFAGCLPDLPDREPEGDYETRDELA
jgi:hypothetical protein